MPILRREETPDTLAPKVLYLWSRKWTIIAAMLLAAIAGYVSMIFWPSEYKAKAELYVTRLTPPLTDIEFQQQSPATVAVLLKDDELLYAVRDKYVKKFDVAVPPEFEKFVRQFTVKTEVLQDTTVRKELSPVVQLSLQTRGREETRFLMETWTREFIRMFGNYATAEAVEKLNELKDEDARLDKELRGAEAEQADLTARLPVQQKMLAELMDLLAPAEWKQPVVSEVTAAEMHSNLNRMQVSINQPPPKPPGLVAKLAQANLDLTRSRQQNQGNQTSTTTALEREVAALNSTVRETSESICQVQKTVADLQHRLSTATRDVQVKSETQRQLHRYLDKFTVLASFSKDGDVRILSQPVMPELRAWPKRTLVGAVAALVALVLAVSAILLLKYLREAAEWAAAEEANRKTP